MYKPWYSFLYIKSPIAKVLVGTLSLLITLAALGFQSLIEESRMAAQTANWDGRSIEKGAEIWNNNCKTCHGPEGKGGIGVAPPLNSKHFFEKRLTEIGFAGNLRNYVRLTVAGGRPVKSRPEWAQNMPTWGVRFGGPLRDDQVDYVTNFVLNWQDQAIQQTDAEDPWTTVVGTMDAAAAAAAAAPAGPQPPQALFVSMGCGGCHVVDPNSTQVMTGPNLGKLPEVAATRKPGVSATDYVHESIVNPSAFTVEGFPAGVMPPNFAERMSAEEIDSLVAWLLDPNRTMP
ncbi:MAG: c-type cytochrome [Caldilineaceae bacterium]